MARAAPFVKTALAPLRQARLSLLDQLYPPACLACDTPVAAPDTLCAHCFHYLRPITAPFCQRLGIPLAAAMGAEALSAEAIADPPPFERARAAVVYGDLASLLVSRLKYGDRPELARFCARLMAAAGRELWAENPILVPVPLHRGRLWQRRYNQAAELARHLARDWNLACDPLALTRSRATPSQGAMTSAKARRRNVQRAFRVPDSGRIADRRVLLLDDVVTTGATVEACARALKRAGAKEVHVLALARVVKASQMPI